MKIMDGLSLPAELRALLRPGEAVSDNPAASLHLPRWFYEVSSWSEAKATKLTAHFTLAELMVVDARETDLLLRSWPHYVPCTVGLLALALEDLRARVEAPVFISANGGYRSPAHRLSKKVTPHAWACAADIYRIGDTWLDSQKSIERFARVAEAVSPAIFTKPYGHGAGETDDHLHLDLGFVTLVPRGCCES